jgi:hypothetical protein
MEDLSRGEATRQGSNQATAPDRQKSPKERELELVGTELNISAGDVKDRNAINSKIKWTGNLRHFRAFKEQYEAWLYQNKMHYVLNPRFRKAYIEGGWHKAFMYAGGLSRAQVESDSIIQYGALKSCCADSNAGRRYLARHQGDMDGIMVWYHFLTDYGKEGNRDARISEIEYQLTVNWYTKYPGGIKAYLDMIATCYNDMDAEDPTFQYHAQMSEAAKIRATKARFAGSEYGQLISAKVERAMDQGKSFDEFVQDVIAQVDYEEDGAMKHAIANARRARREESESEGESSSKRDLRKYINRTKAVDHSGSSFHIGRQAFRLLMEIAPDVIDQFEKRRQEELRKERSTSPRSRGGRSHSGNNKNDKPVNITRQEKPDIPRQYTNPVAMKGAVEDDDDMSDVSRSSYESSSYDRDYEAMRTAFRTLMSYGNPSHP